MAWVMCTLPDLQLRMPTSFLLTSEAKEVTGVVGVWTADDLELSPYLAFPLLPPHFARPPLAKGKVRLVGDIIAVVVADSFAAAADAASMIWMDYDPLPAVTDPEKSSRRRSPCFIR